MYVLLIQGTTPLGAFGLGELAGHFSSSTAVVAFGAATVAATVAIWLGRHWAAGNAGGGDAR